VTPTTFAEANRTLGDNGYRSEAATNIVSLRVWTDGEQCVSCWRMSWRERLSALLFGRVWLQVLSGDNQPPVALTVGRSPFEKGYDPDHAG